MAADIKDTLVVKHLSNDLTLYEKEQFLRHFGAIQVQCLVSKFNKYNLVFARFPSPSAASVALKRLHQLDVLGYPLTVEYVREKNHFETLPKKYNLIKEEESKDAIKKKHKEFLQKLNSWHHSIQPARPPPHHLRYEYPPATVNVLTNICRSLASVPRFYTQVLHLMNRMNLPCPFGTIFPGPPLFVSIKQFNDQPKEENPAEVDADEGEEMEESEESEMEFNDDKPLSEIIPVLPAKRRKAQSKNVVKKKMMLNVNSSTSKMVGSLGSKQPMLPEEVFERETQGSSTRSRKIEMHLEKCHTLNKNESTIGVSEEGVSQPEEIVEGFGIVQPSKILSQDEEGENQDEVDTADGATISLKDLRLNRLSVKGKKKALYISHMNQISSEDLIPKHMEFYLNQLDQAVLPVFKNYQAGAPSCRLYVKNIAKQVQQRDLHFIYRSFIDVNDEEQIKMFDIRLMQEGRMKGQAFITLPTVAQAQTALKETNGYILKNKPLVVHFARSAKPK